MFRRQAGMTMISIMVIVAALVFVAMMVFRVAPVYVDDASIKNVVASFDGKNDMSGATKKMVEDAFYKRLRVNNVSIDKDYVSLTKEEGDWVLIVEYEPRGNLLGSLDYIVSFYHEARFAAN